MFKRTNSYLLLTMLVLTGFAGKIHNDTLTAKERRQLVQDLKVSRAVLSETIEGLSEKQFHFVTQPHQLSIKGCIDHLAGIENLLWEKTKSILQQPPTSFSRTPYNDKELASLVLVLSQNKTISDRPDAVSKDLNTALRQFRDCRQALVKYVRTTTANLHQYTIKSPKGELDIYQLLAMNAKYTEALTGLIDEIRHHPGFPR